MVAAFSSGTATPSCSKAEVSRDFKLAIAWKRPHLHLVARQKGKARAAAAKPELLWRVLDHLGCQVDEACYGRAGLFGDAGAIALAHQDDEVDGAGDKQRAGHHQRDLSRQALGKRFHSFRTSAEKV